MPKIVEDENIYRAVMQIVSERGYSGATTKEIAKAANISEVTLFRKYSSKAQLVKQAMAATAVQVDFAAETRYTGDISADLLRVVQAYQALAAENSFFFYSMFAEMSRYPELGDLIQIPMGIVAQIGQLLALYQAEGVLQQEDPLHAAAALLGPLITTNMMNGASPELTVPPRNLSTYVDHFLYGRHAAK